jgi:hypothetical protein
MKFVVDKDPNSFHEMITKKFIGEMFSLTYIFYAPAIYM